MPSCTFHTASHPYLHAVFVSGIRLHFSSVFLDPTFIVYTCTELYTPGHQSILYDLGVLLQNTEDYPQALQYLTQLVELYPDHLNGASQLGACYMRMKELEKAQEIFEGILRKDPAHMTTLNNLGEPLW